MRISAKGEYGIRAMLDLTLHQGRGLVPIQEIAQRQRIPQRYLEQVLLLLRRAGFLESKRGATGGYQLVKPPEEVSVGDVLRAIDGRIAVLEVAGRGPGDTSPGSDLAALWQEVADAVGAVIDRLTFAELADRARARRSPHRAVYHI